MRNTHRMRQNRQKSSSFVYFSVVIPFILLLHSTTLFVQEKNLRNFQII